MLRIMQGNEQPTKSSDPSHKQSKYETGQCSRFRNRELEIVVAPVEDCMRSCNLAELGAS